MKIGVIGAGKIGALRIATIQNDPNTELAAVFDLNPDAARAAVGGTNAQACSDLSAFLDVNMDAVIVSTPPHLHEDLCVAAFERGFHVLCEKPLSNTVKGAQAIVNAAKKANRKLATGFNLRYYPFVSYVRDMVNSGCIGKIDHIRIYGGHIGLSSFGHEWEYKQPHSGGGAMMDIGIHMTDIARHFMGEITSVYGVASEAVWNIPGSEDNAMAIFRSHTGLTATYHASWTEWKGYRSHVEVYGELGMVRGSYAPMQNLLVTKDTPDGPLIKKRKFYPEIMVREKLKSWKATCQLSFQDELRDFVKMVNGDHATPIADGHAGQRAVEIANAVHESTKTGAPVILDNIGNMNG